MAYSKVVRDNRRETGEHEFIVEKYLKHKTQGGVVQFYTKWKEYPEEEAIWEPIGNFIHGIPVISLNMRESMD